MILKGDCGIVVEDREAHYHAVILSDSEETLPMRWRTMHNGEQSLKVLRDAQHDKEKLKTKN